MGFNSPNGSPMKTKSRCVICNELDSAPKLSRYGECEDCYWDRKSCEKTVIEILTGIRAESDEDGDDQFDD